MMNIVVRRGIDYDRQEKMPLPSALLLYTLPSRILDSSIGQLLDISDYKRIETPN